MVNRIGTVDPGGSNKGFSSRFCVNSWVRHETPEEGRWTYQLKRDYNNQDEVSNPNILSNYNYQASAKKFGQITTTSNFFFFFFFYMDDFVLTVFDSI